MLALMGAMEEEVSLLREDMNVESEDVHAGISVYRGSLMIESAPSFVEKAAEAFDKAFPEAGGPNLMIGTVVSGDKFISDAKTLRWLQREFSALTTEMEGAAVGYTCNLNKLPFVVVRGLSDTAGESASGDFAANLHVVCQNSYKLLEQLIPKMAKP